MGNPEARDYLRFREIVLSYYRRYGRTFPWRETRDPYAIAVSEFMLQQTGAERVMKKYRPFLDAFPTPAALAAAPLKDVLALWSGLGYNRRAVSLKRFAERVTAEFGGIVPSDPEVLRTFPGIGPYTSCSIPAFAYDVPTVFLDTNIRRVYIHFFFPGEERVHDRSILPLVEESLDRENPSLWYAALMDYGTYLATLYPNPNRRSAHYSKQTPYENSNRQVRGRIVALLAKEDGMTAEALAGGTGFPLNRVRQAAAELAAEGFVAEAEGKYGIAKS